jgi:diaminopimelate decarboxylase
MSQSIPQKKKNVMHAAMSQFKSEGDQLIVNGSNLQQLKARAGQTPFYAYDRSVIMGNIARFRANMPSSLRLHYAIKANPMAALVDFIRPEVDGLDVASGLELNIALNSGIAANLVSFAGPGKSPKELEMAIATGVTINIESSTELSRIEAISSRLGITANVAIRVNPDFELKSSGMKMGGGSQQFGIDAEQVPVLMEKIQSLDLNYQGLHIFTGSQNLNPDSIMTAHRELFALATRLHRNTKLDISTLNIGGGLGIPYFPGEKTLPLESIAETLHQHIDQFNSEFGQTNIAMELGRYLVGDAGIYVAEITDLKDSRGIRFAIINGGLHHHLSASGNFGQVIRKNYPVAIGNKMSQPNADAIQVVGPLCTPLDILANKFRLPEAEIGDLVVIYQSGAYGYTASPRDFLSHPQPIEMLV